MDSSPTRLSRAQLIAYELATLDLCEIVDAVARVLWRALGEDTLVGRLAGEARLTMFALGDHLEVCAFRDAGVSTHRLALHPPGTAEPSLRRPRRNPEIRGEARQGLRRTLAKVAAALRTAKAALLGMSAGCGAAYGYTHPLMTAFRSATSALDGLRSEVDEEWARHDRADEPRILRSRAATPARGLLYARRPAQRDARWAARRRSLQLPPVHRP